MRDRVLIEFINTWPSCNSVGRTVEEVASSFGDKVEVKIYYAGKDVSYLAKYGMVYSGTMIINENKKVQKLSRENIEKEIYEAVRALED